LAINEAVVPAGVVRPVRDWWFPLRVLGLVTLGIPLLLAAALLSAAMGGLDDDG
jgi:hypothetical protein